MNLSGAVNLHKKQAKALIRSSEQTVSLRLPVDRVSVSVNPLYGEFDRETDATGAEKGPYRCLWHDALSVRAMSQGMSTGINLVVTEAAGQYSEATAFAEVWLEDVLIDVTKPNGETWFDRAKEALHDESAYQVLGVLRTGLATVSPYLALVALKGSTGYAA